MAAFGEEGVDMQRFQLLLNRYDPNAGFRRGEISQYVGLPEFGCIDRETNGVMTLAVNTGQPFVLTAFKQSDRLRNPILRSYVEIGSTIFPPLTTIYKQGKIPGKKKKRRLFGGRNGR